MKKILLCGAFAALFSPIFAADVLWFHCGDDCLGAPVQDIDSISLSADGGQVRVAMLGGMVRNLTRSIVDSITTGQSDGTVSVHYAGSSVVVSNPLAFSGVDITTRGGHVEIHSTTANEVAYSLTGSTSVGSLKIYSDTKFELGLAGVEIANPEGAAINIQSHRRVKVRIADGTINSLIDSSSRPNLTDDEDDKAAFFSEGQLEFRGSGVLNVTGNYRHAICSDDYIELSKSTINVLSAVEDGLNMNEDFLMESGKLVINLPGKDAKGIKADGNLQISGGNLEIIATGDGGKAISVGGNATFGIADAPDLDLIITAATHGARFAESSSSSSLSRGPGGWGGGGPGGWGGGPGSSGDYCNPKVIKAKGDLIVNSGSFTLTATNGEGGEGLESKQSLTINGGTIAIETVDDCINAASVLTIAGGNVYCSASNNDAIDSNGTIVITGGNIVALGSTQPECGIDCDYNSAFTLNGGTLVAVGGGNNYPTGSGTTQRVASTSLSLNNVTYTFVNAAGQLLLSFKCPRNYSRSMNVMISAPELTTSRESVSIFSNTTLTGGREFHGLTVGGSYSGGVSAGSFTTK